MCWKDWLAVLKKHIWFLKQLWDAGRTGHIIFLSQTGKGWLPGQGVLCILDLWVMSHGLWKVLGLDVAQRSSPLEAAWRVFSNMGLEQETKPSHRVPRQQPVHSWSPGIGKGFLCNFLHYCPLSFHNGATFCEICSFYRGPVVVTTIDLLSNDSFSLSLSHPPFFPPSIIS